MTQSTKEGWHFKRSWSDLCLCQSTMKFKVILVLVFWIKSVSLFMLRWTNLYLNKLPSFQVINIPYITNFWCLKANNNQLQLHTPLLYSKSFNKNTTHTSEYGVTECEYCEDRDTNKQGPQLLPSSECAAPRIIGRSLHSPDTAHCPHRLWPPTSLLVSGLLILWRWIECKMSLSNKILMTMK